MRTINLKDVYCQQCGIYPDGTGDAYGRDHGGEELINIHCSLWVCANWFLVFNGLSRQKSTAVHDDDDDSDDDDDDDGARQPEARHFAITLAKAGAGQPMLCLPLAAPALTGSCMTVVVAVGATAAVAGSRK